MKRLEIMRTVSDGYKIAKYDLELRGPGDFFGSRQHGLPEMKIADLSSDMELLKQAQRAAKETLDIFRAGENDSIPLGDYLLDTSRSVDDIVDIFLMSNTLVFNMIYNQVVLGVADYNQDGDNGEIKTWIDRVSETGPLSESLTDRELDELDDLYYEKAERLGYSINRFVEMLYDAIDRLDSNENGEFDEGETVRSPATSDEEALAIIESIGDGTQLDSSDMDMLLIAVLIF